jgi:hypothetical protein
MENTLESFYEDENAQKEMKELKEKNKVLAKKVKNYE